jgi:hypothetical protein
MARTPNAAQAANVSIHHGVLIQLPNIGAGESVDVGIADLTYRISTEVIDITARQVAPWIACGVI